MAKKSQMPGMILGYGEDNALNGPGFNESVTHKMMGDLNKSASQLPPEAPFDLPSERKPGRAVHPLNGRQPGLTSL